MLREYLSYFPSTRELHERERIGWFAKILSIRQIGCSGNLRKKTQNSKSSPLMKLFSLPSLAKLPCTSFGKLLGISHRLVNFLVFTLCNCFLKNKLPQKIFENRFFTTWDWSWCFNDEHLDNSWLSCFRTDGRRRSTQMEVFDSSWRAPILAAIAAATA